MFGENFMKLDLRDEVKVTLVTALCVLLLIILSNFLKIQIDFVSYLIPMIVLIIYLVIARNKTKNKNFFQGPFFWSILVVTTSAAVLAIYSVV
jgi:predicted membrane chloride channel (bestrophin family)